jgi:mannose-6-phosphate isomerase-like protein (cupin superfamily)
MNTFVHVVVTGVLALSVTGAEPVWADQSGSTQPTFIKGKFAVPVRQDDVRKDWTARGYTYPRVQPYAQGWLRSEHTHDVDLIMTLLTGRMEFVFAHERFVVEPGDELSYPAHTRHSAKNLADGPTQMLESLK